LPGGRDGDVWQARLHGESGLTTTTAVGGLSPGLKGILAMALAAAILTVHDTGTKILLKSYAVNQIVTIRQIFSLIILSLIIQFTSGWGAMRIVNRRAMTWRAVTFISTTVLIVASLDVLPIATVLAIVFASPLIVALLSVPFLGERVGPWRWGAILAGFVGVLVILRPADPNFNLLLLFPVAAAISSGTRDLVTRWAGRTDNAMSILFWSNVATVIVGAATLPFNWTDIRPFDYGLIFAIAILNTAAHFLMILALRIGDAALVSPFRYTALVWAVMLGYLVWGDVPDQWTLIGSGIVIASGVVLAIREARANRRS
jgi:drug/metabolite transporter (DMT)-like permease